jgi:hypothetical protein
MPQLDETGEGRAAMADVIPLAFGGVKRLQKSTDYRISENAIYVAYTHS